MCRNSILGTQIKIVKSNIGMPTDINMACCLVLLNDNTNLLDPGATINAHPTEVPQLAAEPEADAEDASTIA